ncbi:hypothetical protein C8J56DRAFT_906935 [Mycena floridula]|nr:hypothetical protein C8J56DRAFT_906935 [Mycena floridula]
MERHYQEDDIEEPEIQQAILDNLPLKDPESSQEPAEDPRSFLPTAASSELNTLFNQAMNLIMNSLRLSVRQSQADAIANAAGDHFAVNPESAATKLIGLINGGRISRNNDHSNYNSSRHAPSVEHIKSRVVTGNKELKDRVAIQCMHNSYMRESGNSIYPDQNISFNEAGNPFDKHNLPVRTATVATTHVVRNIADEMNGRNKNESSGTNIGLEDRMALEVTLDRMAAPQVHPHILRAQSPVRDVRETAYATAE